MTGRSFLRIVLVIGLHRHLDAIALEQPPAHPRVLAPDEVGRGERRQRPDRDVAQVADRGRDKVQAGRDRVGGDRLAGNDEPALVGLRACGHDIWAFDSLRI
jgi:hypothetical protein